MKGSSMKRVMGAFFGIIGIAIVGIVVVSILPSLGLGPISNVAENAKNAVMNAAIDASGVKGSIESALEDNAGAIADATGLSLEQTYAAIDSLAVSDWSATTLPDTAVATESIDGSALGVDGSVTLYSDPGYVTVKAFGQNVTLSVPPSAQGYLEYLSSIPG